MSRQKIFSQGSASDFFNLCLARMLIFRISHSGQVQEDVLMNMCGELCHARAGCQKLCTHANLKGLLEEAQSDLPIFPRTKTLEQRGQRQPEAWSFEPYIARNSYGVEKKTCC